MTGLAVLAVLVMVALLLWFSAADARPSERRIAWLNGGPIPAEAGARVYRAYLRRYGAARVGGSLVALTVGLVASWNWALSFGSVRISVGFGGPMPGSLVVWWLGGMIFGTLLSESYRLPRRGKGMRQAVLDVRPPQPLMGAIWVGRGVALGAVIIGALSLTLGHSFAGVAGGIVAVFLTGLAEAAQRAILRRPGPASEPAVTVDRRLRLASGRSIAWLELAGAALGLQMTSAAWVSWLQSAQIPVGVPGTSGGYGPACWGLSIVDLGIMIAVVVAIMRSQLRPPRAWQPLGKPLTAAAPGAVA